jgi:hypothetical protein
VDQDEKHFKILELSADVRKFEIGLFWTRSIFFWGFSTLIITAYGAAHYATEDVQFAIACVGIICSVVWTLVNRSSKYWQREWELKAAHAALTATGKNIFQEQSLPKNRSWWRNLPIWEAHFSVSKLAIAFSDLTACIWLGLALKASPLGFLLPPEHLPKIIGGFTIVYLVYIFVWCRPDQSNRVTR